MNTFRLFFEQGNYLGKIRNRVILERDTVRGKTNSAIDFLHDSVVAAPRILDGYVQAIFFEAMQAGAQIDVAGPMSRTGLRNLHAFAEAWQGMLPEKYKPVELNPEKILEVAPSSASEGRAIQLFTGGVDSTFTAIRHALHDLGDASFPVSDCLMVHGLDVRHDNYAAFERLKIRVGPMLEYLGLDAKFVWTDIRVNENDLWEQSHATKLSSVLHQFSTDFQFGLIASSEPYSNPIVGWGSAPSTDYLLSTSEMDIVHDGAGYTRTEKVRRITEHPVLTAKLKVCWEGENQSVNCGKCEKCIRTQLNFLANGLENPACFPNPLKLVDIESLNLRNALQLSEVQTILDFVNSHFLVEPEWAGVLSSKIERTRAEGFGS